LNFKAFFITVYLNICGFAGINEIVEMSKTLSGKKEIIKKKKYLLVSMHSCRRSFCTNAILTKATPSEVMLISGHSSVKVFNNY